MAALGVKGLVYVCDVEGDRVCVGLLELLGLECACWARLEAMHSGLKLQETGLNDSMDRVREPAELVRAETYVCLLYAPVADCTVTRVPCTNPAVAMLLCHSCYHAALLRAGCVSWKAVGEG